MPDLEIGQENKPAPRLIIPIASATASSRCQSDGCHSTPTASELPDHIWQKIKDHPCYSVEAHQHFARMHVAVAPACNIQCNYCNRKYDCSNESRPGVTSEKLTPEQAVHKVLAVASEIPQLSVVGIAGPGDALANPAKTFRTFELLRQQIPDIKLCLSTNGLALPEHVETIKAFNVDHVTITINMVDPEIGAQIYPWIFYQHQRHTGIAAAQILHQRQMEGLEQLTRAGILVKVNSVMIPGINDQHLAEVNRVVKAKGAFLHNIMPLISDPAHGTFFGLNGQCGPTPQALQALQDQLEGGAQLMRHCRQCRADAVGMLGEDRSQEFTREKLDALTVNYDPSAREDYRSYVEQERADQRAAQQQQNQHQVLSSLCALVAVATKGGGRINQHFGHANEFQIFEVSNAGVRFVGHRKIDHYCKGGYEEEEAMPSIISALEGCAAVLVAKIGLCPQTELRAAHIEPVEDYAHEYIEASVLAWFQRYAIAHTSEPGCRVA